MTIENGNNRNVDVILGNGNNSCVNVILVNGNGSYVDVILANGNGSWTGTGLIGSLPTLISLTTIPIFLVISVPSLAPTFCL